MKKIFLFVGMVALLATSCNSFKSEEKPLTDDLVTYTAEGNEKGEVFLGVKEKGSEGTPLIAADNYTKIIADEYIITCFKADDNRDVYTLKGTPIGEKTYKFLVKVDVDNNVYYKCITPDDKCVVYFPYKETINCDDAYISGKKVYLAGNDGWDVYNNDGTKIWSFKNDAVVIKNLSTDELIIAVPSVGPKKIVTATLYSPDGKQLKKLNANRWKVFQKKLNQPDSCGLMKFYELKTVNLKKL